MHSLCIVPRAGRTTNKTEFVAPDGIGVQTCYRRMCGSTPGHWDSGNPALALSLRRCRATAYTSSTVLRFTNMLLFPRPFGSRLVVRLGVICPELRPLQVAIPSVRDMAHDITAPGSSGILASASRTAIAFSKVGTDDPAHHVRSVFPVKAAYACQSLPHVNGATVSEYYELIRLPATVSSPTCLSVRLTWTLPRSGQGLPSP